MGRTRDEINLRSFLGIKSGGPAKFGLQPEASAAVKLHANAALWGYLICASRRYISLGVDGMACSLDSPFLRAYS